MSLPWHHNRTHNEEVSDRQKNWAIGSLISILNFWLSACGTGREKDTILELMRAMACVCACVCVCVWMCLCVCVLPFLGLSGPTTYTSEPDHWAAFVGGWLSSMCAFAIEDCSATLQMQGNSIFQRQVVYIETLPLIVGPIQQSTATCEWTCLWSHWADC